MNVNTQTPSHQTIDRGTQTDSSMDSNVGKFLRLTVKKSLYENFLWDARDWTHERPIIIQYGPGLQMRKVGVSTGIACGLAAGHLLSLGPLGVVGAVATGFILGGQAGFLAEAAFIRECQRLGDLERAVRIRTERDANQRSGIPRDQDRTNAPPSYDESQHYERLRQSEVISSV
ncbi:hypothetical protein [Endozoicomonas sp. 8E]|uniref:hypothetical protein n=1 Tax=Endozoicomonas sp. 8E TaxID=3035692 RepID=UPI002939453C|nr:hypothetical protein [Endozoicomonas sp. 8E]WOG25545.1 hypothetical protein P6910_13225 [Endozoicomonas sp. 8E]